MQKTDTDKTDEAIYTKEEEDKVIYGIGFKNNIGDQNSYYIVIMHFFHYTKELKEFLYSQNFTESPQYIILQRLKEIQQEYDQLIKSAETEKLIDIGELRKEIADLFLGEEFFQLGKSGDPADLLFFFLNAIHSYSKSSTSLKYTIREECNPECPSHKYFLLNLVKQTQCKGCEAKGDPIMFDNNKFIYDIKLKNVFESISNKTQVEYRNQFFALIKQIKVYILFI